MQTASVGKSPHETTELTRWTNEQVGLAGNVKDAILAG